MADISSLRKSASLKAALLELLTVVVPILIAAAFGVVFKAPPLAVWMLGIVVAEALPLWIYVRFLELRLARRELAKSNPSPSTVTGGAL